MIEEMIIYNLFANKKFFSLCGESFMKYTAIFDNPIHKKTLKYMKSFFNDKREIKFDDILLHLDNDKKIDDKSFALIKNFIGELKKKTYENTFENLKIESLKFLKDRLLLITGRDLAEYLRGDSKNDLDYFHLKMNELVHIEFDEDIGVFLTDDWIFNEYDKDKIKLGFPPLDNLYGDGIPKKSFNVILAGPHTGKSQTLLKLAICSAFQGQKATYVTAEMQKAMTRQRIDSILLQMPTLKINKKHLTFEEYKCKMKEARKHLKANLNIKYYSSSTANANQVAKHLKTLREKHDFNTDVLFLDSVNLMKPIDTRIKKNQQHIFMEAITVDFREMCDTENVTLITATQTNKESLKAISEGADICPSNIGGFFMMFGFADSMVGIKNMYIGEDKVLFNDSARMKPIDECINDEIDLSGLGEDLQKEGVLYTKVNKYNLIKSRFGTTVGEYVLIGSNPVYSDLIDLDAKIRVGKVKKINKKVENVINKKLELEKKQFEKEHNDDTVKTFSKKRRKL